MESFVLLDQFRQDLAYSARSLRRSPLFFITAVILLALGIGVNMAEVAGFLALEPKVVVPHPESFYRILKSDTGGTGGFSVPAFRYYREHVTVLSALLGESSDGAIAREGDGAPLDHLFVSGNYFSALGVSPLRGRLLTDNDGKPGAEPVTVIGFSYWRNRFRGESNTVNRVIRLNGKPVRIVGILPQSFTGVRPASTEVWIPIEGQPYLMEGTQLLNNAGLAVMRLYGRAKPGVTAAEIEAQFGSLTAEAGPGLGRFDPRQTIRAESAGARRGRRFDPQTLVVLGMFLMLVLFVLITACANLGNMMLARGAARKAEIRTRLTLGASRGRLVRQLMTESLLLAGLASIAALPVAWLATRWISYVTGSLLPLAIDWRIALAGVCLGALSTLIFGLVPALQSTQPGARVRRVRRALIALQVTLSCVLLILGNLLTAGLRQRVAARSGSDRAHVLVVNFGRNASSVRRQQLDDAARRLMRLPEVTAVGEATYCQPFQVRGGGREVCLSGVDGLYFSVMRLAVTRGRSFRPGDNNVVLVSQSGAAALYPNRDPVGQVLPVRTVSLNGDVFWRQATVVGTVADSGLEGDYGLIDAYEPIAAGEVPWAKLVARTTRDPRALLTAARLASSSPGLEPEVTPLLALFGWRSGWIRSEAMIIVSLAAVATLLAGAGIMGLIAYSVARQAREIGIRLAVGASRAAILRTVLSQYVRPVGIGAASSLPIACWFSLALRGILFGLSPFDPSAYAGGLLVFVMVSLLAALVPALRATRIDPAFLLRSE
jgi:macrolide transport system ATP-binding/permease protein